MKRETIIDVMLLLLISKGTSGEDIIDPYKSYNGENVFTNIDWVLCPFTNRPDGGTAHRHSLATRPLGLLQNKNK